MKEPPLNLRVLKRSRGLIRAGDIFAAQPLADQYIFGRVIAANLPRERAPMPAANLIYVYRIRSSQKVLDVGSLIITQLLIPPVFTNRMLWTKGYFETVGAQALASSDLLPCHCFRTWKGQYVDLDGSLLAEPSDPCGDWALTSYRMIDDMISDALGIPRAPNQNG